MKGNYRDWLLVLIWIGVGLSLRLFHLTSKPLWTDEFSTIVFSLGNSFRTIPLDQPIAVVDLLRPLHPDPNAGIGAVVTHLLTESNHPPLYFVLTHWWLSTVSSPHGLVSLWVVRSLPALLGTAAIPAIFGLARLAFQSKPIAHLAAALMAVSPFGIYLAQEARHYTLPVLWIIASLACLVVAVRAMGDRLSLPLWLCCLWILVNALGIATHYFVALTLIAEGFVIVGFAIFQYWHRSPVRPTFWGRISIVAIATLASGLVWLPVLQNAQDSELTRWIYRGDRAGLAWLDPIAQAVGGWISMLYLLPIQARSQPVVILSVMLLVLITGWTVPILYQGLRAQVREPEYRLAILALGGFVVGAIALFFAITYFLGMDINSAFRYNFVYFPAVVVLIAVALSTQQYSSPQPGSTGISKIALLILCLSFVGGLTVATNLGYQKTHRPDLVAQAIQEHSQHPVLVAIAHRTHGQTGRLMGLAWELTQHSTDGSAEEPLFLLAHQTAQDTGAAIRALRRSLLSLPRPLDLWLINFEPVPERPLKGLLQRQSCLETSTRDDVDGYKYVLYRCQG